MINAVAAAVQPQVAGQATGAAYDAIAEELIACTPHIGDEYDEDNVKVFQILQDMGQGSSFESSIKSHQKSRTDDLHICLSMPTQLR